ncbi:hypothetical protein ACIRON_18515 [Nocardioides sp. NPDC101246]|uniref:hypothetical protein n=1 Tax=Nocardioides sp. NPDC101246 TaxID=3364336 RepID=UPI003806A3AD
MSHEASPAGRREWGPIDVPVYCRSCGKGTEHRWADFLAERIECQVCRTSRPVEHVEGDPAL